MLLMEALMAEGRGTGDSDSREAVVKSNEHITCAVADIVLTEFKLAAASRLVIVEESSEASGDSSGEIKSCSATVVAYTEAGLAANDPYSVYAGMSHRPARVEMKTPGRSSTCAWTSALSHRHV